MGTRDSRVHEVLTERVWALLAIAQTVNSLVFVYDGLIVACQAFAFTREVMETGVGLVFFPMLFLYSIHTHSLFGIWAAKLALNMWRALTLSLRIHFHTNSGRAF